MYQVALWSNVITHETMIIDIAFFNSILTSFGDGDNKELLIKSSVRTRMQEKVTYIGLKYLNFPGIPQNHLVHVSMPSIILLSCHYQ